MDIFSVQNGLQLENGPQFRWFMENILNFWQKLVHSIFPCLKILSFDKLFHKSRTSKFKGFQLRPLAFCPYIVLKKIEVISCNSYLFSIFIKVCLFIYFMFVCFSLQNSNFNFFHHFVVVVTCESILICFQRLYYILIYDFFFLGLI